MANLKHVGRIRTNKRRVIVASQRIGFDDLIAGATSKWAYKYKAS